MEEKKIKPWRIAVVVLSTLALLIGISIFYPKEGIKIAGKDFYFLRFEDVIKKGKESKFNPDDWVAGSLDSLEREFDRLDALSSETAKIIALESANADTTRLFFPNENRDALDSFFEALYRTKETKEQVRVIHYGDSQIEEDRITSYIRKELQARFGGSGLGMVSARPISGTISASHSYSNNWKRYTAFTLTGEPLASKRYGSMGITCKYHGNISDKNFPQFEKDTTAIAENEGNKQEEKEEFVFMDKNKGYLTLRPIDKNNPNLYNYDRVRVFLGDVQENIQLNVVSNAGQFQENISAGVAYQSYNFDFNTSPASVSVTFSGGLSPEIYGVSLESASGVIVDNIAMRGSDGSVFVKFQQTIAKAMFEDLNPRLIILQFGGNVMPGLSGEKGAKYYGKQLTNSINFIRRYCPNASFFFVGPADMAKVVNGQLQTYPMMETLIKELRNVCNENNIAYFDMYRAMGGRNSMIQWVNKGWASKDYIHFNRRGAEKMAEIMYKYLMLEYELFLLRTGKERKKDA
jgi:lysophospholipase L1-like esterase